MGCQNASAQVVCLVMQRLAALVPRPRLHLIRCHEVLASNAKLPALVVPQGPKLKKQATEAAAAAGREIKPAQARPGRIRCARLFKRVFDSAAARCAAAAPMLVLRAS